MKVLHINLTKKEFDSKSYSDLKPYIGGVGLASKLFSNYPDANKVVLATGPLNGYFPFASKTCAVMLDENNDFLDTYVGGKLSVRMQFSGNQAIVLEGRSPEPVTLSITDSTVSFLPADSDLNTVGIPGKRSVVSLESSLVTVDRSFYFGSNALSNKFYSLNVFGLVVSATENVALQNQERYEALYNEILNKKEKMTISAGDNHSCSGCPLGCNKSLIGENGGNALLHSLVACNYSEHVYSDISTIFSCLNVLGLDYLHEDLEALPNLVYSNVCKIYEAVNNSKLETK